MREAGRPGLRAQWEPSAGRPRRGSPDRRPSVTGGAPRARHNSDRSSRLALRPLGAAFPAPRSWFPRVRRAGRDRQPSGRRRCAELRPLLGAASSRGRPAGRVPNPGWGKTRMFVCAVLRGAAIKLLVLISGTAEPCCCALVSVARSVPVSILISGSGSCSRCCREQRETRFCPVVLC